MPEIVEVSFVVSIPKHRLAKFLNESQMFFRFNEKNIDNFLEEARSKIVRRLQERLYPIIADQVRVWSAMDELREKYREGISRSG